MGARVVAVIFCMTGVMIMSYTESPEEEALSGRMLSLTAAAVTALNEVLTRLLIGKLSYQETINFLGLHGICSSLLLWWVPLMIFIQQKVEESAPIIYPSNEYICATILFFFLRSCEAQASFTLLKLPSVMKFLFLQGKSGKDIHTEMSQTLRAKCSSYSTVKTWISHFKTGHFTAEGEPRSGRPQTSADPATCDAVHELIIEDWRISAKKIGPTLDILRECIGFVINVLGAEMFKQ
ncbi:uncharacterized protein [Pyxicephalus adspersus]|uniref:uncharacterized protein n=1 Tax=Pyxicephalus adspersus TaxID=30357 RepID=UPI003B5A1C07